MVSVLFEAIAMPSRMLSVTAFGSPFRPPRVFFARGVKRKPARSLSFRYASARCVEATFSSTPQIFITTTMMILTKRWSSSSMLRFLGECPLRQYCTQTLLGANLWISCRMQCVKPRFVPAFGLEHSCKKAFLSAILWDLCGSVLVFPSKKCECLAKICKT